MTIEERIAALEKRVVALEQSTRPVAVTAEMIFAGQLAAPTCGGQLQLIGSVSSLACS